MLEKKNYCFILALTLLKNGMLLERQKLLLCFTRVFDSNLSNTNLMKYLFLFIENNPKYRTSYSFVPYNFGCFSFEVYQDKKYLTSRGYFVEPSSFKLSRNAEFSFNVSELSTDVLNFKKSFDSLKGKELVRYVYLKYPYYAINSKIKADILTREEIINLEDIGSYRLDIKEKNTVYTIGYESCKIEDYINKLIKHNVSMVVDVRKNAFSMKYNFSKNKLADILNKMGIKYLHIPELGIESSNRKNLNSAQDYRDLFSYYERSLLPQKQKELGQVYSIIKKNNERTALTCFEKDHNMCHRSIIAKQNIITDSFEVAHI
jgi:uncharacterized protein (DUF488 family)